MPERQQQRQRLVQQLGMRGIEAQVQGWSRSGSTTRLVRAIVGPCGAAMGLSSVAGQGMVGAEVLPVNRQGVVRVLVAQQL